MLLKVPPVYHIMQKIEIIINTETNKIINQSNGIRA